MSLQNYIFVVIFLAALAFFTYNLIRIRSYLMLGRSENRFDNIAVRIKKVLLVGIAQTKILRDPAAGIMHALIFWGFMVLLTAVTEAFIQGFYTPFSISVLGSVSKILFAMQDIFGFLVILSVIYALYRRYIVHPKRLEGDGHTNADATFILLLIFGVMITMFGTNAVSPVIYPQHAAFYKGHFIASLLTPLF